MQTLKLVNSLGQLSIDTWRWWLELTLLERAERVFVFYSSGTQGSVAVVGQRHLYTVQHQPVSSTWPQLHSTNHITVTPREHLDTSRFDFKLLYSLKTKIKTEKFFDQNFFIKFLLCGIFIWTLGSDLFCSTQVCCT